MSENEMFQLILNEIKNINSRIDNVEKNIDSLKSEIKEEIATNQNHISGILARQELALERISKDMTYLVSKEADNSHQIFLLNKSFGRL